MTLAAVVLTYNEEQNIVDCLSTLDWVDQRVVLDSLSTDRTVALAQEMGAEVFQHPFENYARQRNVALEWVEADWIFFVDADERVPPELAAEVRSVLAAERPEVGWWVPRHNYIFGRLTRGAGWYPDYQLRLVRRGYAHWERAVHEIAVVDGPTGYLQNPLIHYNYDDMADFIARQERYTDYDAAVLFGEGIRPHFYTPYSQAVRHFWWRFVTLKGFRDGWHGLRLSLLMAYYEAVKYRKLARLWREKQTIPRAF
ncbi:MAG: glycosyltransferase family 2 protein [Chloroflexi bacterium]|nr:glycosyltransferase family 2 protein [Chloroflexota bacterium]